MVWQVRTGQDKVSIEDQMSNQPDFKLSADSAALVSRLKEASVGEVVSYEALSKIVGRDVQSVASGALHSARHIVQREVRVIFGVIRGVGLKRLSSEEIVDASTKDRHKIRRHAIRSARKLVCVDYDQLTPSKQVKHNAELAAFGVLQEITTEKAVERISKKVEETKSTLPIARAAMEALGSVS
ncbi:hypothetical protein AQ709_13880 [Burkholderia pseudomallei]|nr:hypothetical protein AQ709_13880 [Burkholderia pseudomallei]OMQ74314.1 hypothetical protein AQ711_23355 [Burkholderia pseudomallei]OMQ75044.1 hypothetical protein AQ712_25250 [Burkholderia pseudomallei]